MQNTHSRVAWAIAYDPDEEMLLVTTNQGQWPFELVVFCGDGETPSIAVWRTSCSGEPVLWLPLAQA